jgi:hypothetical protein
LLRRRLGSHKRSKLVVRRRWCRCGLKGSKIIVRWSWRWLRGRNIIKRKEINLCK